MDRGFSLIELLVVIAIVSILSGLAIPQYKIYKQRAFDMVALSDLRNIATAEEAYFVDAEGYLDCADAACTELPGVVTISQGAHVVVETLPDSFTATAWHDHGTGKQHVWISDGGGLQP